MVCYCHVTHVKTKQLWIGTKNQIKTALERNKERRFKSLSEVRLINFPLCSLSARQQRPSSAIDQVLYILSKASSSCFNSSTHFTLSCFFLLQMYMYLLDIFDISSKIKLVFLMYNLNHCNNVQAYCCYFLEISIV